nr:PREDICTED: uncharacterized protein LOC103560144 [Equus przewalskii]
MFSPRRARLGPSWDRPRADAPSSGQVFDRQYRTRRKARAPAPSPCISDASEPRLPGETTCAKSPLSFPWEPRPPESRRLNSAQREAVAPHRFPGAGTGVCGRLGRRGGGLRGGGQAALPPGTSAPKFSSASGRPRSRGLGVPRPRRPGRPGLARPCWAPARTAPSLRASACHPRPRACAPRQIWDGVGLLGATHAPFPGDVTQAELSHHLPDDPCSRPEALLFLSVLPLQLAPIPLAAGWWQYQRIDEEKTALLPSLVFQTPGLTIHRGLVPKTSRPQDLTAPRGSEPEARPCGHSQLPLLAFQGALAS